MRGEGNSRSDSPLNRSLEMSYFEFIGTKVEGVEEYVVTRSGRSYVFAPNVRFQGRWICRITEPLVADELQNYTKTFRVIREKEALKEDEEFVRTIVENADVVREILETREIIGEVEKEPEAIESDEPEVPLEEMEWVALRKLAKDKGVLKGYMKKKDMIEALKNLEE